MSDSADSRLDRLRHRELQRAVENLPEIGDSTARWLGIVYDGGHAGSLTGGTGYALMHPCEINGDEDEGAEPTILVDTNQSRNVLVLNHAPRVNDLLVVHGIGGRWVAQRVDASRTCTGCIGCEITICLIGCIESEGHGAATFGPVADAAVQVKTAGGTTIVSGTTDATGCVTLDMVSNPGTYHWEAQKSGYISITDGVVSGCCTTTSRCMDLSDTGFICDILCGKLPSTVTITEAGFPTAGTGTATATGHRCISTQTKYGGNVRTLPFPFGFTRHYVFDTTGGTATDDTVGCTGDICVLNVESYECDPLMIVLRPPPMPDYGTMGCNCIFRGAASADVVITITA